MALREPRQFIVIVLCTYRATPFILYIHISQQAYIEPRPEIFIVLLQYTSFMFLYMQPHVGKYVYTAEGICKARA